MGWWWKYIKTKNTHRKKPFAITDCRAMIVKIANSVTLGWFFCAVNQLSHQSETPDAKLIKICLKSIKVSNKIRTRDHLIMETRLSHWATPPFVLNEEIPCKLIKVKLEGFWSHFILPLHRNTTVRSCWMPPKTKPRQIEASAVQYDIWHLENNW